MLKNNRQDFIDGLTILIWVLIGVLVGFSLGYTVGSVETMKALSVILENLLSGLSGFV